MKVPIWLKAIVTFILAILIAWQIGPRRFVSNIEGIHLDYLFYALLFFPLVIFLGTEKWYAISKDKVRNPDRKSFLISFLGGMSIGLITPARVGEFSRVLFLESHSKAELTGIAFVDRVIDLQVTLILGVWSVFILLDKFSFFIFSSVVLLGLIFLYRPQVFMVILRPFAKILPFEKQATLFLTGMNSISARVITQCLLLRTVVSIIDLFQFYILINAFSYVSLSAALAAYPLVIFANILPITIGGVGIREGVSAIILARFNVAPETAVSASFLLFCINTLLPGLIGTFFVTRIKLKKNRKYQKAITA